MDQIHQIQEYGQRMTKSETRSLIVNDIMSYPVITAKDNTSVREIALLMKKHDVDSVVVTDKFDAPVGIITEGDIVRELAVSKRHLWLVKAKHIMSRPVVTTSKHVKLEDAARMMAGNSIKKLCVVDDRNKLIGIITAVDVGVNASYLIDVLKEIIHTGYYIGEDAELAATR